MRAGVYVESVVCARIVNAACPYLNEFLEQWHPSARNQNNTSGHFSLWLVALTPDVAQHAGHILALSLAIQWHKDPVAGSTIVVSHLCGVVI